MAVYYKPQSPIQSGEDFIYPITTADQVKVDKDTRLNAVGVYLKNIDNSTDTTVYGNNATTLGGVAAEDYALKTDTAPDSSKLGGKTPEYYIQPRNLLDNSDFRNPVNQRGQTSYTGLSYYIDRWRTWNDAMSGNLTDNGLVLVNSGDSNNQFVQYLDSDTTTKLTGKILTLACLMETGRTYTVTVTGGETANNYDEMISEGCYLEIGTGNGGLLSARFYVKANSTSNAIVWAALYEGSYTAETLPPYVPKGYAAELAECQRYYLPVIDSWSMGVVLTGTGYICLNIPTNIKMRISPTPIISNPRMYHPTYDWVDLTYRGLDWYAPFYRIIFNWPSNIQASISDIVLINGVTGLSADL